MDALKTMSLKDLKQYCRDNNYKGHSKYKTKENLKNFIMIKDSEQKKHVICGKCSNRGHHSYECGQLDTKILDKDKLASSGLDFLSVSQMIKANNTQLSSGSFDKNDTEFLVNTGKFLASVNDVENLVVGVQQNQPIYLKQIANIVDGPEIPQNYVSLGFGQASDKSQTYKSEYPAVTISVAKRKGADAMKISELILGKVTHLRSTLIPDDVHVEVTRNYGETASHKVSELLWHLIGSIFAVTLVVMLAMGWRGGLVVFLSVPITFALTLLSYYMLDYTLNRITLFALVFVTGIVVDPHILQNLQYSKDESRHEIQNWSFLRL